MRKPVRSNAWSSTSITRIAMGFRSSLSSSLAGGLDGQYGTDPEAAARPRSRVEGAADHADPLTHADQALAEAVLAALLVQLVLGAASIVLDEQGQFVFAEAD